MRILRSNTRGELLELVDRGAVSADPRPASSAPTVARLDDFDSFYRREFTHLLVLARAMAGPLMADDVAQEAMLAAYRRWDEVRAMESPVAWVRTVCLRKAVSVSRRRTVERRVLRQLGSFRGEATAAADDDEWFWSLVRQLPLRQAQVVALHYALDLAVADIATTLGCAEGTVKAHLARARTALAALLGVPEEDER